MDWLDGLFPIQSVFGRLGDVVAQAGDYTAQQVYFSGASAGLSATNVQAAIEEVVAGRFPYNEIVVNPSGTQLNYEPTGWQDATHVHVVAGTSATIRSFAPPAAGKPHVKVFTFDGRLTFNNEVAPVAGARITSPQKHNQVPAPFTARPRDVVVLSYSQATGFWRAFAAAPPDEPVTTAVSLTGTANNVAADRGATAWLFVGAGATLTGIAAPDPSMQNVSTAPKMALFSAATTIAHQSTSSTDANRIITNTGANLSVPSNGIVIFQYIGSGSTGRWLAALQ